MNLHPFEKQFLQHCRHKNFFRPGDRLLVAVSGGMDSCVLFHLLLTLREPLAISLGIAHVNHGLRGKQGDSDELFTEALATQHAIPFYKTRLDIKSQALREHLSIEEAARKERYAFLISVAHQHNYQKICTGHHLDDQAETVLSRVLKGAGWEGLSGIRETRDMIVRPLLPFTRSDIQRYAQEKNILYRTDSSNSDLRFFRNKIRHHLLPMLQSDFDPKAHYHLYHLSMIAQETEEYFQKMAPEWLEATTRREGRKIILDIQRFKNYLLIQRKCILSLIVKILNDNYADLKLTYHDFLCMLQLTETAQSGRRYRIGPIECRREHQSVIFQTFQEKPAAFDLPVQMGSAYQWAHPPVFFSSQKISSLPSSAIGASASVEYIDEKKIRGQLFLRNWKTGDSFCPIGMTATKKLSDFFTDQKIPLSERPNIPILVDRTAGDEQIIWICGYRLDNRYKIEENTTSIIKLECHRHDTLTEN